MKKGIKLGAMMFLALVTGTNVMGQKKVKHFKVEKIIDLPADKVWAIVGGDYGGIANSHPKIINSEYTSGSLEAKEGAERMCYFNDKGTQYLHEKMINFSPSDMTFTNTILMAGKFPVDPAYTTAIYKVEDLRNGKCKVSVDMKFRTTPAMMGGMMMGSFTKLMSDYFISIEHNVKTGEKVTQDNFKEIKKMYSSDETVVTKYNSEVVVL